MNNKLYLSGKITGLPTQKVEAKFKTAQRKYERCGIRVINPLNIRPFFGKSIWLCYMIADVWRLLRCGAIVLLHDWHDSRGARIECLIALLLRKRIIVDRPVLIDKANSEIMTSTRLEEIHKETLKRIIEEQSLERRLRR